MQRCSLWIVNGNRKRRRKGRRSKRILVEMPMIFECSVTGYVCVCVYKLGFECICIRSTMINNMNIWKSADKHKYTQICTCFESSALFMDLILVQCFSCIFPFFTLVNVVVVVVGDASIFQCEPSFSLKLICTYSARDLKRCVRFWVS